MYFTFVDRFANGNKKNDRRINDPRVPPIADYMGGDLAGISQKITDGYFDGLSVNALWISPITQNPESAYQEYIEPRRWFSGYHGYWPISSSKIDHRFGTEQGLKQLVSNAHNHNTNVLLDFVCNHVHEDHPIYRNDEGRATDLYLEDGSMNIRIWDDERLTTWFDVFLPTLDLENDEVINLQVDSAMYWLKKYNLDGFRHDATKHVPLKFWRTLTRKIRGEIIKKEQRPVYQIGETYGSDELIKSYIQAGLLDAQFDFNLFFTARDIFAFREGSFLYLNQALSKSLSTYGYNHLMGNITGNHDQVRFMGLASGAVSLSEDHKEAGYQREISIEDESGFGNSRLSFTLYQEYRLFTTAMKLEWLEPETRIAEE